MTDQFKVGELIRYGEGSTAIMKITEITSAEKFEGAPRYYGEHILSGFAAAHHKDCRKASKSDKALWNKHHPAAKKRK